MGITKLHVMTLQFTSCRNWHKSVVKLKFMTQQSSENVVILWRNFIA